jgi:hypothetical protein
VDSASIITVKDVVKELINAIEFIQDMNPEEIVNVTDIAAEILPEGVIEVNLGLVLPPDKNVLLTFTVIL